MKVSRREVRCKAHVIPVIEFQDQTLTSFSGLIVFQQFFAQIDLKGRLAACFRHLRRGKVFGLQTVFLQLIVHLLMGFREWRHCEHYRDDPLVKRLLGLNRIPDVGTISRIAHGVPLGGELEYVDGGTLSHAFFGRRLVD